MTVQDTLKLPRTPRLSPQTTQVAQDIQLSPQATRAVQVDQPAHHPWNRNGCRDRLGASCPHSGNRDWFRVLTALTQKTGISVGTGWVLATPTLGTRKGETRISRDQTLHICTVFNRTGLKALMVFQLLVFK